MQSEDGVEFSPRKRAVYRTDEGTNFEVVFSADAEVPEQWESPRTGQEGVQAVAWIFSMLFAVGFAFGTMGLIGYDREYQALLSGLVLYFIIGALVAVFYYTSGTQVGAISITDADSFTFWTYWMRFLATWPFQIVVKTGFLGYDAFSMFS